MFKSLNSTETCQHQLEHNELTIDIVCQIYVNQILTRAPILLNKNSLLFLSQNI